MRLKPGQAVETFWEAMGGVLVAIFATVAIIGSEWIGGLINHGVASAARAVGLIP